MPSETHSLTLKVDSRQVKKAEGDLNGLTNASGNTEKATNKLSNSNNNLSSSFLSLNRIISATALSAVAIQAIKTSDEMNNLQARIKLVTSESANLHKVQSDLVKIANQNKVGIQEVSKLYIKLADPIRQLGGNLQTTLDITNSFSKALLVSGASTEEAASSLLQFSQAMGSGVLRGDEFNSIAENSPRILKAVADSLGVAQGALRGMAAEGKLTAGMVGGALLRSMVQLEAEAISMPNTVSGAFQILKNNVSDAISKFDDATNTSSKLAGAVSSLNFDVGNFIDSVKESQKEGSKWIYEHEKGIGVFERLGTSIFNATGDIAGFIAKQSLLKVSAIGGAVFDIAGLFETDADRSTAAINKKGEANRKNIKINNEILAIEEKINNLDKPAEQLKKAQATDKRREALLAYAKAQRISLGITDQGQLNKLVSAKGKEYDAEIKAADKLEKASEKQVKNAADKKAAEAKAKADAKKAISKTESDAKKEAERVKGLEEDLAKLKVENNSDALKNMQLDDAKAYQEAIVKREQQLEKFKGIKGAELEINKEFNNQVEKLNIDLVAKQKIIDDELFNIATKRQADTVVAIYEASIPDSTKIIEKYTQIFEDIKDMPVKFIQTAVEQMNTELANIKFDSFKLEFDAQSLEGVPKAIAAIAKSMEGLAKADKKYNDNKTKYAEGISEYNLNEQEHTENQIVGYANMAGAMSNMFADGSREAAAFQAVQSGLAVVNAVASIMNQASGDPYTTIPRMVAVAAMAAQTLSKANIAFSGGGGGSAPALPKSTVLGAKAGTASESTTAIVDILSEAHASEYKELRDINRAVTSMAQGIESAVANIFKSGVLDTSGVSLISTTGTKISNFLDKTSSLTMNPLGVDIPFISNIVSSITGSLNSLFGGSSKQYVAGSGFDISGGTLGSKAAGNVGASTYLDVETMKKKFYGSTSYSHDITTTELDKASTQSISLIYKSFSDTMSEINKGLGTSLAPAISNYAIDAVKISTAGLSGEEVVKTLNDRFSALGDKMTNDIFGNILNQYQDLGEGLLQTAVRVITEKAIAVASLKDIGFDKFDLSSKNIWHLFGTTFTFYTDKSLEITQSLVDLAGGLTEFQDANTSYYDKYFTDAEKQVKLQAKLSESFSSMGVSMPTNIEGLRKLVEGTDLTTLAGQELFTGLMDVSDGFAEFQDNIEVVNFDDLNSLLDSVKSFVTSLRTDIIPISSSTSFITFSQSFNDMVTAIGNGSDNLSEIGTKAIDNARSYLDTITATASAGRDIAFAKAVVANKFESVVMAPNITIGTVNDTLKYSLGEQSYIVSELRAMRQELITANQLGITQTANSINQLSATRALLPA